MLKGWHNMSYTSEAKSLKIPKRMKDPLLDLFNYLASAPKELGIIEFGIFGSVARQQARFDSDIDILVISSGLLKDVRYFCTHERCLERQDIQVDIVITDPQFSTGSELFTERLKQDYIPIWRADS